MLQLAAFATSVLENNKIQCTVTMQTKINGSLNVHTVAEVDFNAGGGAQGHKQIKEASGSEI